MVQERRCLAHEFKLEVAAACLKKLKGRPGSNRFGNRKARFHRARRATHDRLAQLLNTLSQRIVRVLERRGLLIADAGEPYLEFGVGSNLDHIQAASINYRIAVGPHAGRKAVTLASLPRTRSGEPGPEQAHSKRGPA